MKRTVKRAKLVALASQAMRDNVVQKLDYETIADNRADQISELLTPKAAQAGRTNVENFVNLVNGLADHCERRANSEDGPYPNQTKIGETYSLMKELWGGRLEFATAEDAVNDAEIEETLAEIRAALGK